MGKRKHASSNYGDSRPCSKNDLAILGALDDPAKFKYINIQLGDYATALALALFSDPIIREDRVQEAIDKVIDWLRTDSLLQIDHPWEYAKSIVSNYLMGLARDEKDDAYEESKNGWRVIRKDNANKKAGGSKESVENPPEATTEIDTKTESSLFIEVGKQFTIGMNGEEAKFHIVNSQDMRLRKQKSVDPNAQLISVNSPLAKLVTGLRVGDTVDAEKLALTMPGDTELLIPKDKKYSKMEIREVKEGYLVPIQGKTLPDTEGLIFAKPEEPKEETDLDKFGGEPDFGP